MSAMRPVNESSCGVFKRIELESAEAILERSGKVPCYLIRESRKVGQVSLSVLDPKETWHCRFAFDGAKWQENNEEKIKDFEHVDRKRIEEEGMGDSLFKAVDEVLADADLKNAFFIHPSAEQQSKLYRRYGRKVCNLQGPD